MVDIKNPLSEDDKNGINERLNELNDAQELLRKMENAGMDVVDKRKQLDGLRTQLLKLKQAFGA